MNSNPHELNFKHSFPELEMPSCTTGGQSGQFEAGKVYYVPHHEVIYVGKETTKLPVPYDAGA